MEKRISSRETFFFKRIFPVFWFGIIALVGGGFLVCAVTCHAPQKPPLPALLIPAVMAVIGYVIMRVLVFDLVDKVWDGGDHLTIVNAGLREIIPISDIINVSYTSMVNPPRISLLLKQPGGRTINFMPVRQFRFNFLSHPVYDDLIARVHARHVSS